MGGHDAPFVPGLPFCYQLEPRERQVEVPNTCAPRSPRSALRDRWRFAVSTRSRAQAVTSSTGSHRRPCSTSSRTIPTSPTRSCFPQAGDILSGTGRSTAPEFDETRAVVEAGELSLSAAGRGVLTRLRSLPIRKRSTTRCWRCSTGDRANVEKKKVISGRACPRRCRTSAAPDKYEIGMPPSGAMDQYSLPRRQTCWWATTKGRQPFEATYIGPTLQFTDERLSCRDGWRRVGNPQRRARRRPGRPSQVSRRRRCRDSA